MKKMRLLISIIFMGLSCSAYPMNPDTVTVECSDGKELSVSRAVVRKVGALHGCLDTCTHDNDDNFSLKDVDVVDVNVKLDSQTLQNLFLCIQDLSNVKELSDEDKNDLCIIGDYLSVDEKRQEDIIFRIINYCDDFDELPEKVRSLIKDITQQLYTENKLNLANKRVDSLQNIERIVPPENRNTITAIDCSRNKLKKLDVKKLKQIFPNLTHLNAQGNCLNDASIGRIGQEGLVIDLSGNCLSGQEVEKIKKVVNNKDLKYITLSIKNRLYKCLSHRLLLLLLTSLIKSLHLTEIVGAIELMILFIIIPEPELRHDSRDIIKLGIKSAFVIFGIAIIGLKTCFSLRNRNIIESIEQKLQRKRNILDIGYQISPERLQRIRDHFVDLGNNQHNDGLKLLTKSARSNLYKKLYNKDGLKLFVKDLVAPVVTRSYR